MSSDPIGGPIVCLLILILAHAYLANAEAALKTLHEDAPKPDEEDTVRLGEKLSRMIQEPKRYILALRICRNLCVLFAGGIAAYIFLPLISNELLPAAWNNIYTKLLVLLAVELLLMLCFQVFGFSIPQVRGEKYVYRHPAEGSETFVSRVQEKKALELAHAIGVEPSFLYMDENEGWKISRYVEKGRKPDYDSWEDSLRVLAVLRRLHEQKRSVDWDFLPWEDAARIEEILRREKGGIADRDFEKLKEAVGKCFRACQGDGVERRFCHCDTYRANWLLTEEGDTILLDWEYAGNADPGCDVGGYIMDAMWQLPEAEKFIEAYCGEACSEKLLFHYLAYTAIISYYWYVWALYREACGAVMGESLYNWHVMAKRYSKYLIEKYAL